MYSQLLPEPWPADAPPRRNHQIRNQSNTYVTSRHTHFLGATTLVVDADDWCAALLQSRSEPSSDPTVWRPRCWATSSACVAGDTCWSCSALSSRSSPSRTRTSRCASLPPPHLGPLLIIIFFVSLFTPIDRFLPLRVGGGCGAAARRRALRHLYKIPPTNRLNGRPVPSVRLLAKHHAIHCGVGAC